MVDAEKGKKKLSTGKLPIFCVINLQFTLESDPNGGHQLTTGCS
jgi:hypothetical protein